MAENNNKGIKSVLRKIIKGKSLNAELRNEAVSKRTIVYKITDADDDNIPFGWENDLYSSKKGKKTSQRLVKKIKAQITPHVKKEDK